MPKQKTHEEFLEDAAKLNTGITVLGRYINSYTPIRVKCNVCGYEWNIKPSGLLLGRGCHKCKKVYRRTHKDFVEDMLCVNPNIKFLEEFRGVDNRIKCECVVCNHKWEPKAGALLKGHGCPNCALLSRTKSHECFLSEVKMIHPNIQILDKYQKNNIKVRCKCLTCDTVWQSKPNSLLQGYGCPTCGRDRKHHDEFVQELKHINPDVIAMDEYHRVQEKIRCKCRVCGNEWSTTPAILLQGKGCPKCVKPKSEVKTERFLIDNKIDFIAQKRFDGLIGINGYPLSYDFYIPNNNILIELQGRQHYMPIDYFGGEDFFNKQQEHDRRKREFANAKKYTLIEIPYVDFDKIEDVLHNKLIFQRG